jgi:ribosome-binding protein aMBF1 (putative translation factor)
MPEYVTLNGGEYVIIAKSEYDRLTKIANLPAYPEPDTEGTYPAVDYARVSLARKLIRRREALGWSQADLAKHSGMRVETLNRIERGKTTPSLRSVQRLDESMRKAESAKKRSRQTENSARK